MRYPHLYVREGFDDYERKVMKKFGFNTNSTTRPVIIALLKEYMRDTPENCVDYKTLGEMLTFARNEKGRAEALPGEHDDLVMSLAITLGIRSQQKTTVDDMDEGIYWNKSQWEDYRKANASQKAYLIAKWGKPRRK